jgi:hypothetical protein
MGREIKRVPVDFDWPVDKRWQGYLMPDRFRENPCPDCKNGYSPHAQNLFDLWYGYLPFHPASNGSVPLTADTPAVRTFAERNYGAGGSAIVAEAERLANLWNEQWSHHLNAEDVAALVEAERLTDLTHTWDPENRWQKIDPPVMPTAAEVNEWSLRGLGHDSINASVVIRARCQRDGQPVVCASCQGHASQEAHEGQRAEADAWERTEPPSGDGWQLWETVTEGSPVSPVFVTAEALARWMSTDRGSRWAPHARDYETALRFIEVGWAPSGMGSEGSGFVSGVDAVGGA